MTKKLLVLGLVVACGGEPARDSERVPETDTTPRAVESLDWASEYDPGVAPADAGDLGQLGQAYSAKRTANYQFGTDTASGAQCGRATESQNCTMPVVGQTKTVNYSIPSHWSGFIKNEIRFAVEDLDAQLTGWTFNEVLSANSATLLFSNILATFGWAGYTSSYVTPLRSGGVSSLEEVDGVYGQYRTHEWTVCHMDFQRLDDQAESNFQYLVGLRRMAGLCTLYHMGLGWRLDPDSAFFMSSRNFDLDSSPSPVSVGEKCRANSYTATSDGWVTWPAPQACSTAVD